jgi:hypothetical protein
LKPGNVEHTAQELWRRSGGVFLCVADGGFSDAAIPPNQLELYFYRLFLAELHMATSCLQTGGRFICKLYTSFSAATSSLLFLTSRLFESVQVIKPMSSKVGGPERYLVATGFRDWRQGDEPQAVCTALARAHNFGAGLGSPMRTPLLSPVVSPEGLLQDASFTEGLQSMVVTLCKRQALALHAIRERAELLEEAALDAADRSAEQELKQSGTVANTAVLWHPTPKQQMPPQHCARPQMSAAAPEFVPGCASWGARREPKHGGSAEADAARTTREQRRRGHFGGA